MDSSSALLIGDLAGVAVFAASGGSAGVAKRFDFFGVVFVGFVAALGGISRDLVLNSQPVAFTDRRYGATAAVAAAAVLRLHAPLVLVFVVRLTALYRRWSAPRPKLSGASGDS